MRAEVRNKKILGATALFVLVLSSLFLVACSSNQQPSNRPLYSGSYGMKTSFPASNALQQFEKDVFTVAVRLENDGTSSVTASNPGFVVASFDPAILSVTSSHLSAFETDRNALAKAATDAGCTPSPSEASSYACLAFSARSRTQYSHVGDVLFAEFSFKAKNLPEGRRAATTPLVVQTCYPYTTTFVSNICVDRDLLSVNPSAPCNSIMLTAQPQGAPVAVTRVVPRYSAAGQGVNARYEITLRNLQNGLILSPEAGKEKGSVTACNLENLGRSEYGIAIVNANLSTIPLKCGFDDEGKPKDKGTARFVNKEAVVVCSYTGSSLPGALVAGANYEAPLIITVQYYYIERLTSQIEVIKS